MLCKNSKLCNGDVIKGDNIEKKKDIVQPGKDFDPEAIRHLTSIWIPNIILARRLCSDPVLLE